MTLGRAKHQPTLWEDLNQFCERALASDSIYALLHGERDRLFPDEFFADLFSERGRRSVPPSVVATVMVLQRLEGCSDREAVERYSFDARWRYAAGVGGYDGGEWGSFAHTVLVDMRESFPGGTALGASRPGLRSDAGGGPRRGAGRPAAGAGLDPALRRGGDDGHGHADPARRCVGCCAWRTRCSVRSCGACCAAATTTPARLSRSSAGNLNLVNL
jgi:hypothetical protein